MLIAKLVLVPTLIALIAVVGRLWGASAAGLLSGLPVIAGPIIWFIYLENGLVFAQQAAIATIGGIVALSSFCFSYSWLGGWLNWRLALLLSTAGYFLIALLMGNLSLGLGTSILLAFTVIILQLSLSPRLETQQLLMPASLAEILSRMVFALVLVLGVTSFAELLGEIYSGIFATFPIAGSTIAVFSHKNYSAVHAMRSMKSMKQGLLSMVLFFYIVAAASDFAGFSGALIIAAIVAVLLQVVIVLVRKNYQKPA